MKPLSTFGITLALVATAPAWSSQDVELDWLYLNSQSSWMERSAEVAGKTTALTLPIQHLDPSQLWWQASHPQAQLHWVQPDASHLPKKGEAVEIDGASGIWLIKQVASSHLVIQQGREVRYWPHSQWHQLRWNAGADFGLTLTLVQPEAEKGTLHYAWQSADVRAQVLYRLTENDDGDSTLIQELVVQNHGDVDVVAPGYSYAHQPQPVFKAMRAMSMEMADSAISTPESGESAGIPTLFSNDPVRIPAKAHLWLPVQQTPLEKVARRYQLQWDSRSQGQQLAQARLQITAESELPSIGGPVKIGLFDQQLAVQQSQYQPTDSKQATLDIGQSPLVSVNSVQRREGEWRLTFVNRSAEVAPVDLTIYHWNGRNTQQIPMLVTVPANAEKVVDLELGGNGLIKQSR